jgi:hypothetical protein
MIRAKLEPFSDAAFWLRSGAAISSLAAPHNSHHCFSAPKSICLQQMPVYSPQIASEICERLANGEGLNTICISDPSKFPTESAVRKWVSEDVDGFSAKYTRARDSQAEHWAEEIITIPDMDQDPVMAQVVRNRVEARKWVIARMSPRKWGDRIEQRITDGDGGPLTITVRRHDKADK